MKKIGRPKMNKSDLKTNFTIRLDENDRWMLYQLCKEFNLCASLTIRKLIKQSKNQII